jgi:hypothetical protein
MILVNPFFVNPFTIWTNFALKSGEAMLEAAEAATARREVAQPLPPPVAEIPDADAPRPKSRRKAKQHSKANGKAKGKKRRAKR